VRIKELQVKRKVGRPLRVLTGRTRIRKNRARKRPKSLRKNPTQAQPSRLGGGDSDTPIKKVINHNGEGGLNFGYTEAKGKDAVESNKARRRRSRAVRVFSEKGKNMKRVEF